MEAGNPQWEVPGLLEQIDSEMAISPGAAKTEAKTRAHVAESSRQGQSARLEKCLPSQSWINADYLEERLFRTDLKFARNSDPKLDNNKKQDRLPPAARVRHPTFNGD